MMLGTSKKNIKSIIRRVLYCTVLFILVLSVINIFQQGIFYSPVHAREALQNYDVSNVKYGPESNADADVTVFHEMLSNADDPDISGILADDEYYNSFMFKAAAEVDAGSNMYSSEGIERDIKYFNNSSHIAQNYYKIGLLPGKSELNSE